MQQNSLLQPHFRSSYLGTQQQVKCSSLQFAKMLKTNKEMCKGSGPGVIEGLCTTYLTNLEVMLKEPKWQDKAHTGSNLDPQFLMFKKLMADKDKLTEIVKEATNDEQAAITTIKERADRGYDIWVMTQQGVAHLLWVLYDIKGTVSFAVSATSAAVMVMKLYDAPNLSLSYLYTSSFQPLQDAIMARSPQKLVDFFNTFSPNIRYALIGIAVIGGIIGLASNIVMHKKFAETALSTLEVDYSLLAKFNQGIITWMSQSIESKENQKLREEFELYWNNIDTIISAPKFNYGDILGPERYDGFIVEEHTYKTEDSEIKINNIRPLSTWEIITNSVTSSNQIETEVNNTLQKLKELKDKATSGDGLRADMEMMIARAEHFLRPSKPTLKLIQVDTEKHPMPDPAKASGVVLAPPYKTPDGRFELSEAYQTDGKDHLAEAGRIGAETQWKLFLHWFFNLTGQATTAEKYAYFSNKEEEQQLIYQYDKPSIRVKDGEVAMQHVSHACQLIQANGLNILTDPVFGGLAPVLYPAKTKTGLEEDEIPPIDVILISHNHRDHLDVATLQKFLKHQPKMLVPVGDGAYIKSLGFSDVTEFTWFEQIKIHRDGYKPVQITATPADHWANRSPFDAGKSLVNGWFIDPQDCNEAIYFAGDTARLSDHRIQSIAHICSEARKADAGRNIVNLEPGGPNYSRQDMGPTHQSAVDSVISTFRLAKEIAAQEKQDPKKMIKTIRTIFMHHNKFELGPDRFNENVMIYQKLCKLLSENDKRQIIKMWEEQRYKAHGVNPFEPDDSFIYKGALELIQMCETSFGLVNQNAEIVQLIEAQVGFPLIGERTEPTGQRADYGKLYKHRAEEVQTSV